jgi:hypothetical protein
MAMQTEHARRLGGTGSVALHVDGVEWRFSIAAMTRVDRELFINVTLDGPEQCSVVVHLRDQIVFGVTAREILNAACAWLLDRRGATHAYIDLAPARPSAVTAAPAGKNVAA